MDTDTNIIVLRYRDLVTESGETIEAHKEILRLYRGCWWGWFKRNDEILPIVEFGAVARSLRALGSSNLLLFDTDLDVFHVCQLTEVAVGPGGTKISSPEPHKTPEYYNRGRHSAWFLFSDMQQIDPPDFRNIRRPTHRVASKRGPECEDSIVKFEFLRQLGDVTLWVVDLPRGLTFPK